MSIAVAAGDHAIGKRQKPPDANCSIGKICCPTGGHERNFHPENQLRPRIACRDGRGSRDNDVPTEPRRPQIVGHVLAAGKAGRYTFPFPLRTARGHRKAMDIMVHRPRTKLKLARKAARCPKCGVLVGMRVRCKTCHKKLQVVGR